MIKKNIPQNMKEWNFTLRRNDKYICGVEVVQKRIGCCTSLKTKMLKLGDTEYNDQVRE